MHDHEWLTGFRNAGDQFGKPLSSSISVTATEAPSRVNNSARRRPDAGCAACHRRDLAGNLPWHCHSLFGIVDSS